MNSIIASIIVPMYNTEQYISRCLDSLVQQSRRDIEIVVVDDGSTDGSREIVERYVRSSPELVKYFFKANGGLPSARKLGFEMASGKYITFVDSDDWLHPDTIRITVGAAERHQSDVVYFLYARVSDSDKSITPFQPLKTGDLSEMISRGSNSVPAKLWSRQLLEDHAEFPDMWHEDLCEVPALLSYCKNPCYIDRAFYYYYVRESGSITTSGKDPRRKDILTALTCCYERMNPRYLSDYRYKMLWFIALNLRYVDYFDTMVEEGKKLYEEYELADLYDEMPRVQQKRIDFITTKMPVVARNLFLNGFYRLEYDEAEISSAFTGDYEIVWIQPEEHELSDNLVLQRARNAGDFDYIACYFALKEIAKRGGAYCSSAIKFPHTLNSLRFKSASFAFDDVVVSSDFFMGSQDSKTIEYVLEEFESDFAADCYRPAREVITSALICKCNLKANGRGQDILHDTKVYSVDWFVFLPLRNEGVIQKELKGRHQDDRSPFSLQAFKEYERFQFQRVSEAKQLAEKRKQTIASLEKKCRLLEEKNATLNDELQFRAPSQKSFAKRVRQSIKEKWSRWAFLKEQ